MYNNNINHIQNINNGMVQTTRTSEDKGTKNLGTSSLGKDAFLQLLVTQLRYQDPNCSDTEFIAQPLRQCNLNQSYASPFNLVGWCSFKG